MVTLMTNIGSCLVALVFYVLNCSANVSLYKEHFLPWGNVLMYFEDNKNPVNQHFLNKVF